MNPAEHARRIIATVSPFPIAADDVVHAMIDDDVSALTPDERPTYDVEQYAEQYRPVVERVLAMEQLAKTAKELRVPMTHTTRDDEYADVLAYRLDQEIASAERQAVAMRELRARVETQRVRQIARAAREQRDDVAREAAYSDALTLVACGEDRDVTRTTIVNGYPTLEVTVIDDVLADALRDALKQGVEREDVDGSWYA